jgi:hypothetical protein
MGGGTIVRGRCKPTISGDAIAALALSKTSPLHFVSISLVNAHSVGGGFSAQIHEVVYGAIRCSELSVVG